MLLRRILPAFLGGCLLLFATACDDDLTGVGAGVGPDSLQGGAPETIVLNPTPFQSTTVTPVTGNGSPVFSWRVLTGTVDDPLTGRIETTGYVELEQPVALPDTFFTAAPSDFTAELDFIVDYEHGDTTSTVEVDVYPLEREFDFNGIRSDSVLTRTDSLIATVQIGAEDDTLSVPLSNDWIANNVATLRDTTEFGQTFADRFHGFALVPRAGNRVIGSTQSNIRLSVFVGDVRANYTAAASHSRIQRTTEPEPNALPDGQTLLLTGTGEGIEFNFALDSLRQARNAQLAVNLVDMSFPVDTLTVEADQQSDFVRPEVTGYRLFGFRADDAATCQELGFSRTTLADGREPCLLFSNPSPTRFLVSSNLARGFIEPIVRDGETIFTSYIVVPVERSPVVSSPQGTTNLGRPSTAPVLFYTPDAVDGFRPRMTITVTPL